MVFDINYSIGSCYLPPAQVPGKELGLFHLTYTSAEKNRMENQDQLEGTLFV